MPTVRNQTIGRMSPRQKMINLMYIVLTAMLALNVSSDVLNGFSQVEDGLTRSNRTISERNNMLFAQLQAFNEKNPEKGGVWYRKAVDVKKATDALYNYIDTLKLAIVRQADGADGNVRNIRNLDNLDAASVVMLAPAHGQGKVLRQRIDAYRDLICKMINDPLKRVNVEKALSTQPHKVANSIGNKSWEEGMFENMPVIAAVTLLSKLQNDLRYAEGEVLNTLITNVDLGDIRVNAISAFVIPDSKIVMSGGKYSASIVLAAVDTTARPAVFVNGRRLTNDRGLYEFGVGKAGTYDYSGYIQVQGGDGTMKQLPFKSSYTVIEPMATVSATMMNVLYAGINNPISIAVPGIPNTAISASMTNGSLTRSGDAWVAHPSKVGAEAVITVTANMNGHSQTVATSKFRVRKLPDPQPFIAFSDGKGNTDHYKGGRPFAKSLLLQAAGIGAAIDDDMLNVTYRVISFETVFFDSMGNAIPEVSSGSNFSQRQRDSFRRLQHGKRFYITRVHAVGPDGIERIISPMEVIVN
jgi:gliding motility-associated protein GldM